ncbi:uncharacterized protein MONBRDRAFT_28691 [Monosiga brevicollis MX1]|uniref:Cyclin N-terminal domain-containing protein n=1 Tax=Monosiga brevicollis TaxID=81824 RepID=A9V8X1_MONBE|nr:uncharacterized protein MONBRDRAFT_28691 [Monosiga brevicollis MX1]EDQ86033.1 predicted protein [Monosiga brevicollis MX1]|eukprot:XP_001749227.1 hypothetical protein [Monosiga brevicollis MX1]
MTTARALLAAEQLADSPSRRDDISAEKEARYRREGAVFIRQMAQELDITAANTIATCIWLFHRFYVKHSFKNYNRWNVAGGCFFAGLKAEEQPKRCKQVVPVFAQLKARRAGQPFDNSEKVGLSARLGCTEPTPAPTLPTHTSLVACCARVPKQQYLEQRERLLAFERFVLQELEFDLHVDHPFPILFDLAQRLESGWSCFKRSSGRYNLCVPLF